MSRSAGISWRAKAGAVAALLLLSACSSNDTAMSEKLAAAEAAADKAIAAQKAAEKAAATAASLRPAPPVEPRVVSDMPNENGDEGDNGDNGDNGSGDGSGEVSMGGEGQTVSPDGVVIPGQGA